VASIKGKVGAEAKFTHCNWLMSDSLAEQFIKNQVEEAKE
jgi:hypothetical protein